VVEELAKKYYVEADQYFQFKQNEQVHTPLSSRSGLSHWTPEQIHVS
jgi:hypothetical protein